MDQSDLRAWEARCIQDEPPHCQAACPIHVDVRTFMAKMAAGDFNAAWPVLTRTMPLPHTLCHICDHPCETRCLRNQAGESLAIHLLEKSCIALCDQRMRPSLIRSKDKKIAVIGSSLDGLTVAWDLSRKGYSVTLLHADMPETFLTAQLGTALPPEALATDIALLKQTSVLFSTQDTLPLGSLTKGHLETLLAEFDGVYLSMGTPHLEILPQWIREQANPLTLAGPLDGLYTGGWADPFSPIQAIADGRKAAASLDRYASKVSLTALRDKEGPQSTRLYTSLTGVEDALRIPVSSECYLPDEAAAEASRCLQCQCLECVKICPYLEHFKGYPKTYARQIHNNAAIVKGLHLSNPLINSCSLCGLCEEVCPENFSMANLCLSARQDMVTTGKMPLSAHDFALQDMEFSNSDHFAMVRNQPGHATSRYLFFPGCQICSSRPGHTRAVYAHLCASLDGGVALMLGCCGAPATWAGRTDLTEACTQNLHRTWEDRGRPTIILACSSCMAEFKAALPDIPVVSLWTILD
ncbi:MAG: 4Fe-4S dicluster domain-containing protein [Desulfoplanes sp.]|nr:4Fe-4S dicluster domain-containing protein [Desulfoplanes sp.]